MAPADENECRQMLYTGFQLNQPAAVRYPRGSGAGVAIGAGDAGIAGGQGGNSPRGREIAMLAFGSMLSPAPAAAEHERHGGQHALRQAAGRGD